MRPIKTSERAGGAERTLNGLSRDSILVDRQRERFGIANDDLIAGLDAIEILNGIVSLDGDAVARGTRKGDFARLGIDGVNPCRDFLGIDDDAARLRSRRGILDG